MVPLHVSLAPLPFSDPAKGLCSWGWSGAINIQNWGWVIEFTPAFHAVGFLTGPNAAFSWLFGAVLAYGIIGPILLATGASIARPIDPSVPGWVKCVLHFARLFLLMES